MGQEPRPFERTKQGWTLGTGDHLAQAIVKDGLGRSLLYAAIKEGGLLVVDISAGRTARPIASLQISAFGDLHVMHLAQQGDRLFLALGDLFAPASRAGLAVVDVSTASDPRVVALWTSPEPLHGSAHLVVDGNRVFLSAMKHGLFVFDLAQPGPLRPIAQFLPDIHFPRPDPGSVAHPNARGLALSGDLLFVAFDAGGLRILDVRNPRQPREIGRYVNAGPGNKQQAYNHLLLDGDVVYAAVDYCGLEILDVSDPENPRPIGWWNPWACESLGNLWINSPGHTNQLALDPERQLVYLSAGDSELVVVDVSDPANPRLRATAGEPGNGLGAWGLALDDDTVYLAYIRTFIPFRGTWSGLRAFAMGW